MAGKPISRAYAALIDKAGISTILDRVSNGETMGAIAVGIGVSRWFLSTYLNRDGYVADALELCRAQAAQKRLAAHPAGMGGREARRWVADAPAVHLAALKAIRGETARGAVADAAAQREADHALLRKAGSAKPPTASSFGPADVELGQAPLVQDLPTSAFGPADVELGQAPLMQDLPTSAFGPADVEQSVQ